MSTRSMDRPCDHTVDAKADLDRPDPGLCHASRGELAGGINVANNGAKLRLWFPRSISRRRSMRSRSAPRTRCSTAPCRPISTSGTTTTKTTRSASSPTARHSHFNIPAHLYGLEGEFVWQPEDDLAFNLTLSLTQSAAGNAFVVDQRNPTANTAEVDPGQGLTQWFDLCDVNRSRRRPRGIRRVNRVRISRSTTSTCRTAAMRQIDAPFGIPSGQLRLCLPNAPGTALSATRLALRAAGFDYCRDVNPATGALITSAADPPDLT